MHIEFTRNPYLGSSDEAQLTITAADVVEARILKVFFDSIPAKFKEVYVTADKTCASLMVLR